MPAQGDPQPEDLGPEDDPLPSPQPDRPGLFSCCPRCARSIRRLLPVGVVPEARRLVRIGAPVFVAQLLGFLISVVSSIFCGHLGKIELDAVTLAVSVINVIGISVGTGLASVCDTLMSQTYGSRNVKRVGTILQRGILILLLFCFPCWAIFLNTEKILLLCKQDPEVSRLHTTHFLGACQACPPGCMDSCQRGLGEGRVCPGLKEVQAFSPDPPCSLSLSKSFSSSSGSRTRTGWLLNAEPEQLLKLIF
uniref:Multidrug and toxin extrusion protein n=1 Tax=Salvator merianae TaxID=96440 RepID=A0A8D0DGL4_SALMN